MNKDFFTAADCDQYTNCDAAITLPRANALIRERSTVVYGAPDDMTGGGTIWETHQLEQDKLVDTHTARIICVEPIEQDSAEKLVREILERTDKTYSPMWANNVEREEWLDRAKALLAKEKSK